MHGAKEGVREGYREGKMGIEREKPTQFGKGSINEQSNRGRLGLTPKLDELLGPSMTFEVILMKYFRIHNFGININFNQNRFIRITHA